MDETIQNDTKRVIAAFDFDGTVTTRDTLPVFIWFALSVQRILVGSLLMAPFLVLYKLRFIPNFKAKEKLFRTFFAGIRLETFNKLCEKFTGSIDQIVNPLALEKIKWHRQMGHEVIIISASAENWIYPWAIKNDINTVLATRLQIENDHLTGNFLTQNCHGAEKVKRLTEQYPDKENYILYAYGDSAGDKDLLAFADHSFYRSF
jgi:phosphatidylglycerophosphatase C